MKILNHIFFTLSLTFVVGVCNATDLIMNGNSENEQQQLSPLELKVEALTLVVLLETKARKDLEKRVVEMEKLLSDIKSISEIVPKKGDLNTNRGSDLSLHDHTDYSKEDKDITPQNENMQTAEGVEKNTIQNDTNLNTANEHKLVRKRKDSDEMTSNIKHIIHKRVPELPAPKIAFHVIATAEEPTLANKVITFQNKSLDTANAYSIGDGIYTVPQTGVYVFTWTITGGPNTRAPTQLMINNGEAGRTIADSDENQDYHTSTGITVASVAQGSHVYVKFAPTGYGKGHIGSAYGKSTFSGWKLD